MAVAIRLTVASWRDLIVAYCVTYLRNNVWPFNCFKVCGYLIRNSNGFLLCLRINISSYIYPGWWNTLCNNNKQRLSNKVAVYYVRAVASWVTIVVATCHLAIQKWLSNSVIGMNKGTKDKSIRRNYPKPDLSQIKNSSESLLLKEKLTLKLFWI